jgi:hypothetical protein
MPTCAAVYAPGVDRGAYFFTTDGRLLVRPAETGEVREATDDDRRDVGRVLRIPLPFWRRWLGGEAPE